MKVVEKHIVPQIQNPIRLQEYASSIFKTITTRSGIKKAIKKQLILLNRKPANTGDWIKEGQLLELLAEELPQKKIFRLQLKIIFNDSTQKDLYYIITHSCTCIYSSFLK